MLLFLWRRGRDSNTQHLAVHYISNVAPYQLEYLSKWQYHVRIISDSFLIILKPGQKINPQIHKRQFSI